MLRRSELFVFIKLSKNSFYKNVVVNEMIIIGVAKHTVSDQGKAESAFLDRQT